MTASHHARNLLSLALGAALHTVASPATAADPSGPVPPGYQLVWSDEFNTPGLPDPSKWAYDTGMNQQGWHNRELQYYSGPREANAVVRDGKLILTARHESLAKAADWGGQHYTSSRLLTRGLADWTYGFFEVRAKLPCGKGLWPAIWMLNNQGTWPDDGELDIMEFIGADPTRVFSTVHTAAGYGSRGVGGAVRMSDACTAFHNYQMHWTADRVEFAIDGFSHVSIPKLDDSRRIWPFNKPQFLLLNIAVGGDLGGPVDDNIFPATMEVEHVRVWQAPAAAR
jgi:beta-glucanase (GH16 family)